MEWAMGFTFAVIYVALLVVLGITTLRKGHLILFIVGFFFPLLWVIGALMPQKAGTAA